MCGCQPWKCCQLCFNSEAGLADCKIIPRRQPFKEGTRWSHFVSHGELGWGVGALNSSHRFSAALSALGLPVLHEGNKDHCFNFSQWIELSRRLELNYLGVGVRVCCFWMDSPIVPSGGEQNLGTGR